MRQEVWSPAHPAPYWTVAPDHGQMEHLINSEKGAMIGVLINIEACVNLDADVEEEIRAVPTTLAHKHQQRS